MTQHKNRKNEHVSLAENYYGQGKSSFKEAQFVHHSFPEIKVSDINLTTTLGDLKFNLPFFVNAMTGGSEWTKELNQRLAIVARETGLAMATGSMSAGLKYPEVADSYTIVRQENPNGLVFANLGAGHGIDNAKKAVDLIEADALQIHVNAPQELVMSEGDRDFSNWLSNIESISDNIEVPLIVKEVGFGMSKNTIRQLESVGVKHIDISGRGGTNFTKIENSRRQKSKLNSMENWGQTTLISLLEAMDVKKNSEIISSGGIRSAEDILKSLALGASLVGVSSEFIHMILKDIDLAIERVADWKLELEHAMTLLGAKTINDLTKTDVIISGEAAEWSQLRGINLKYYANRSQ